eukprot:TRINITY_DN53284_c0_g1_i1.p1 TRINITY_DN53284_c0_g1~~TRINITY_DN53284_c0_g1_i1.p1  ORF type:complete len:221 (-),score=11.52 TRINITY_DN53284_c0_g1_i1:135-767(-)
MRLLSLLVLFIAISHAHGQNVGLCDAKPIRPLPKHSSLLDCAGTKYNCMHYSNQSAGIWLQSGTRYLTQRLTLTNSVQATGLGFVTGFRSDDDDPSVFANLYDGLGWKIAECKYWIAGNAIGLYTCPFTEGQLKLPVGTYWIGLEVDGSGAGNIEFFFKHKKYVKSSMEHYHHISAPYDSPAHPEHLDVTSGVVGHGVAPLLLLVNTTSA